MSLQVWLPLNGSLNNQGLSEVTVTNNGATVDSNGKIGSCYLVNSDKQISFSSYPWMTMKPQYNFSCFFWVKGTTNGWLFACSAWEFKFRPDHIQVHLAGDGQYPARYTATFDTDTWYHLGFTWNGTEGKLRLYLNGNLVATSDVPSSASYDIASSFNIPFDGPRYINDFRLYDHCLSAKEVKEISKGLILHYKLSDPYIEPTTNLYSGWRSHCYNGVNGNYSYGTSTDMYYDILDDTIRVRMGTGGLDAWPFVFFNDITPPSNGEYRTLSFDYYPTIKDKINFYSYGTTGTITWIANGIKGTSGDIPVNINSWNHISVTIKNTGSSSEGFGFMKIGTAKHTSSTSNYWLFKNIQIEDKDHSTPFVVGSRDESTVYDCSGLSNDGTKIGGVTPSSSPLSIRYEKSYDFDGSTGSIQIPDLSTLVPSGEFTMNCWIYHDDTWSSKGYETIFGGPSGFELEAKNTSTNAPVLHAWSWGKGEATYELNKWNMITMTRNASETKFYINGELKITGSAGTIPSGNYFIGAWNTSSQQNYKGKISDFRLYSNVLSVEDIQELYNTSASVDKNGNMYAYEFKEE